MYLFLAVLGGIYEAGLSRATHPSKDLPLQLLAKSVRSMPADRRKVWPVALVAGQ